MLNKVIETIKNHPISKGNPLHEREAIEEATNTFNAGWDALENGTVIQTKGNFVALKEENNMIVTYEMEPGCFEAMSGRLSNRYNNKIIRVYQRKEISEEQKQIYLAQAIVTRFYTIKTI